MRRYIVAALVMVMLFPTGAQAQWFLFPGGRERQDSASHAGPADSTFVAVAADSTRLAAVQDSLLSIVPADTTAVPYWTVTRLALILPFKSSDTPNSNFLDFYCGALLAASEHSSEEHRLQIDVFDSSLGLPSASDIAECSLIVGPVSLEEMDYMIPRAPGKYLVSPLDPKVARLTEHFNVIQAPAGWEAQVDALVSWLAEDLLAEDKVVLLKNEAEADGEVVSRLAWQLGERGIEYVISSSAASFEEGAQGNCRFVMASENDEFCSAAIREIALMNLKGGNNIVYSTSRLRGIADLEAESLHAASARITASYYADPYDERVRSFTQTYRKLFKGEPGRWALQGYDLLNYFAPLVQQDPDLWPAELPFTAGIGLQTDFRFDYTGKTNTAVRRLKYNADNTISIIR